MLLRLLSVTGALLGSCAARSLPHDHHDIDIVPPSSNSRILSHFRQITIPCGECSFTAADCTPYIDAVTYLTLSFTTENDTLNANSDPIFPSPVPMQFHAVRHWESGQQAVTLAYALDARPLPPRAGALLGDIFLLKLRLFDLHGRPATDHLVSLSLAKDSAGDLLISHIGAEPAHAHGPGHHHQKHPSSSSSSSPSSWLARLGESLQAVKSAAQSCWSGSHSSSSVYENGDSQVYDDLEDHHTSQHSHHGGYTSTKNQDEKSEEEENEFNPIYWAGKGSKSSHLLQPIVLPALLGVLAGIVACLTGFIVGKTAIAIYYCVRGERRTSKTPRIVITRTTAQEEEGIPAEKEGLITEEEVAS